jgi:hypothetical protein
MEIALGIEEANSYQWQAQITGFFTMVTGQNTQTTGIDG